LEILFLGTSSGAPTKNRNVSAIALIESQGGAWHLIDCGEGTQHQLLHASLSLNSLESVFLTHLHGDHCYGLPGILASAGLNGRDRPLKIIAPNGIEKWLDITKEISQLYLPYELEIIHSDSGSINVNGQFDVSTINLSHRISCYGYIFIEKSVPKSLDTEKLHLAGLPQGPLWGKLQSGEDIEYEGKLYLAAEFTKESRKPRKIVICGDNDQPNLLETSCIDCDLLVHESTYTEELADRAKKVGHTYAKSIASFAEMAKVPNLILTHISARYSDDTSMKKEASNEYSGNLYIANDYDRYTLKSNSVVDIVGPNRA